MTISDSINEIEGLSFSTQKALIEELIFKYATTYGKWILKIKKQDPTILVDTKENLWLIFKQEKNL